MRLQLVQQLQHYRAVLVEKRQQAAAEGKTASSITVQTVDNWIAAISALNALAAQVTCTHMYMHSHAHAYVYT